MQIFKIMFLCTELYNNAMQFSQSLTLVQAYATHSLSW